MQAQKILSLHQQLLKSPPSDIYTQPIIKNPFERSGARKNSVYVGDTAYGDSGKGTVTAEFNRLFVQKLGKVYSLRFNGGANAGHEVEMDGVTFLANQLPVAVAQKGGHGLITRGMVFNPRDGVMEIERAKKTFNGSLPGELMIDERTPLCLDTHRALDTSLGSTGRGIGPAYADFYGRQEVTFKELLCENWHKILGDHYDEKTRIIAAKLQDLMKQQGISRVEQIQIKRLDNTLVPLGTKDEFLETLAQDRGFLKQFIISDMRDLLQKVWSDESIPVTIEEAQGPGLDPYFGIRPDVTSSRPSSRFVQDGTYGVVWGEEISLRVGVTKTVYMSSVGSRRLPEEMSTSEAEYYQNEFGEVGKTTGRRRGICYLSLPTLSFLKKFSNYDYLVATHLDAARIDKPIKFVSHYTHKVSEIEAEYTPYQDETDTLEAHYIELPGWDGKAVERAHDPNNLPQETRVTLSFLSQAVAPVILARTGKTLGSILTWWS